jgi:hypothetical protein
LQGWNCQLRFPSSGISLQQADYHRIAFTKPSRTARNSFGLPRMQEWPDMTGPNLPISEKRRGLSSNDVFDIEEDSFGRIWFFNINASPDFFYNNSIHNAGNTPYLDSLRTTDFFKRFYEDKSRNIYFFNNSQREIFVLDPQNHVAKYKLPKMRMVNKGSKDTIEAMDVRYLFKNDSNIFIIGTPAGYFRTGDLSRRPVLFDKTLKLKDVISSSTGEMYCVTRPEDKDVYDVRHFVHGLNPRSTKAIPGTGSKLISSLLADDTGILWISTYDKGVFCYKGDQLIYHFDIKDAKIITQDHEKNIWISSLKEGVFRISPFVDQHQHFETTDFNNSGIYALAKNDSAGVWCTNGDMVFLLRNDDIYKVDFQDAENSFNQILQVNDHTLLIGETSKMPFSLEGISLDPARKRIRIEKISQYKHPLKKILFNPVKKEISSYNQFTLYSIDPEKLFRDVKIETIKERISYLYYNAANELAINAKKNYTYQNGNFKIRDELTCFNNRIVLGHLNLNDHSELFNLEGDSLFVLSDKQVFNLSAAFDQRIDFQIKYLDYHDSTLVIGTSRNIYICENPLRVVRHEPVFLKLVNINFRSIHDILFNNGRLFVASDDGLTSISLRNIHDISTLPPIPYFQSVQVNDQENLINQNVISLVSTQRINVAFSCISYSISPVIFSYKLDNADSEWTIAKSNNVVLQNLSRGNYVFQLRVRKPTSGWSNPIEVRIKVKAIIWQHPLFYIVVLILLGGLAVLMILRHKNTELRHRQLEHQILLSEQKSLQAMMNPHFIFNSLGSIQNFLLHNQSNEAGVYLSQFARLIRQNLNAINTSMINLEEEVDHLKNYLDLEKLRMGNKFDYVIEIDESVDSDYIFIPSMIVQPFVENAIWHGIANLDEKGHILIIFQLHSEKSLQITVEDTGIGIANSEKFGFQGDKHLNLGMEITKKRLNLLNQKYDTPTGITVGEKTPRINQSRNKSRNHRPLPFWKIGAIHLNIFRLITR